MQVEEIINRSLWLYFAPSVTAGLTYSAVLLASGWLIGDCLHSTKTNPTSWGAMVAALSVIVVLILSEVARGRFQRVIDRQFFREKYTFDQAMQEMRVAVGSLVDRITLGKRLLEGAVEVLRVEWGALYLCEPSEKAFHLVVCNGPTPDQQTLAMDNPLVVRLQQTPTARLSHGVAAGASSDPATDAMIALGEKPSPPRGRRPACGLADPRTEAKRNAIRGRGDGFPGSAQLGGDSVLALGRHPANAGDLER